MKTFKVYQNNKIFDTQNYCYVNLKEVLSAYNQGPISIICNKSKKDITKEVLIQAQIKTLTVEESFKKLFDK